MKTLKVFITVFLVTSLAIAAVGFTFFKSSVEPEDFVPIERPAAIKPDYAGITIPANIAPLNFTVLEPGSFYLVKIHSSSGPAVIVSDKSGNIRIPLKPWRSLLEANRGGKLFFEIYARDSQGRWSRYQSIENTIAKENIDGYIAYRRIEPVCSYWGQVGVFQRNLENFEESVIIHGRSFNNECVNCHSFLNHEPDSMFVAVRSKKYGNSAICVRGDNVEKIAATFGYTAWHPSGRIAAYSFNKVRQFFHTTGTEIRDVVDLDSTIAYYSPDSKTVKTAPNVSEKNRLETYPSWTPDGKYLYFCSAPMLWEDRNKVPPEHYEQVKYELRRISYDVETDRWGSPETVLSTDKTGLSILLPRISPDGTFLLFCMCKYGCFPVYQPTSDLYLMNLQTGDYRKLAVNSEYSESWHSWSSNSRWIAFSSKRNGGLFTRTYFSYVDEKGNACKPFIMPQKDPTFYDSFIETFSVPELITGPVKVDYKAIGRVVRCAESVKVDIPITTATPLAGLGDMEPWRRPE
ncbi:MAG: PD40 domain-containing protein [Sedimentisphaerales bacterium]|nr:PD40 domain-containing protein [Sedimentisphaerales bacterium]